MRKIGTPVTIRVNESDLEIAKRLAEAQKKPLRSLLREIIEEVLRTLSRARLTMRCSIPRPAKTTPITCSLQRAQVIVTVVVIKTEATGQIMGGERHKAVTFGST